MFTPKFNIIEIWELISQYEKNELEIETFITNLKSSINNLLDNQNNLMDNAKILEKNLYLQTVKNFSILIFALRLERFIDQLYFKMKELHNLDNEKCKNNIKKLENQILNFINTTKDSMNKIYNHFLIQSKSDLKKNLSKFALTETEFRICVLIYLNFRTKEIADIQNLSPRSVESHKYRIKKKLKLNKKQNILDFLNNLK